MHEEPAGRIVERPCAAAEPHLAEHSVIDGETFISVLDEDATAELLVPRIGFGDDWRDRRRLRERREIGHSECVTAYRYLRDRKPQAPDGFTGDEESATGIGEEA